MITGASAAVLGVTRAGGNQPEEEKNRAVSGYSIRKNSKENQKSQKKKIAANRKAVVIWKAAAGQGKLQQTRKAAANQESRSKTRKAAVNKEYRTKEI